MRSIAKFLNSCLLDPFLQERGKDHWEARGGLNVRYLRDILKSAKLFIRPLQREIEGRDDGQDTVHASFQPTETCLSCNKDFPLHQLHLHVESGECKNNAGYDDEESPLPKQVKQEMPPSKPVRMEQMSPSFISSDHSDCLSGAKSSTSHSMYVNFLNDNVIEISSDDSGSELKDEGLQEAISQSLRDQRSPSSILAEHREKYLDSDKFNTYRIRVRRRKLWDDGCKELRRNFDIRKHLKVKFIGEKGEDGGGPKREFFFQIMEVMGNQHMLLEGPKGSRTPKHNLMALQSKQFYLIGKIIALSVLNGGPAPKFFSQPILDYLFYGCVRGTRANVLCIPDKEMQEKVLMDSRVTFQLCRLGHIRLAFLQFVPNPHKFGNELHNFQGGNL